MSSNISIPRWRAAVALGMCIGFLYFVATSLLNARGWSHKIGSPPAASQWLDAIGDVLWDFPFGRVVSNPDLAHVLSSLFWAVLASGLFILLYRRKQIAPAQQALSPT